LSILTRLSKTTRIITSSSPNVTIVLCRILNDEWCHSERRKPLALSEAEGEESQNYLVPQFIGWVLLITNPNPSKNPTPSSIIPNSSSAD
jgi:hypothetical protein